MLIRRQYRYACVLVLLGCFLISTGTPIWGGTPELKSPPNVLIIAIDTLRADHLSCYGYQRQTTPNIDKLAAEGVLFENCYSAASWTLPSFTSLFTGVYPQAHGVTNPEDVLSLKLPTLTERFREHGYFAGAIVSNPFLNAKYGFGRGFEKYDDYTVFLDAELSSLASKGEKPNQIHRERVTGESVTRQAKRLIATAKKSGKPCFIFAHFFDPHDSYIPPQPFRKWTDPTYQGLVNGHKVHTFREAAPGGADLEQLKALYDGEVAYDDEMAGRIVREMDANFDPASTIVILVGDHGEAFGEHGMLLHGNTVYREELWVPMLWRWPGVIAKGHRVRAPVSMMDVSATLRDFMRFAGMSHMQSQSLWDGLTGGEGPDDRPIFSEQAYGFIRAAPNNVVLTRGNLRLHARYDRSEEASKGAKFEMYDLSNDPWERNNLSGSRVEISALQDQLIAVWAECQALRKQYSSDRPPPLNLTEVEKRRLEGLGYIHGPKSPATPQP